MYPYSKQFESWAYNGKHLAPQTVEQMSLAVNAFWNYHLVNAEQSVDIKDIKEADVRYFLTNLETNQNLKSSTINKYLSYIKNYFKFLSLQNFIDNPPTLALDGRFTSRKREYIINWTDSLEEIAKIDSINPLTVRILTAISLGFLPKDILKLKNSDIEDKLDNRLLKSYFENTSTFDFSRDSFFITSKFNNPYKYESSIQTAIRNDSQFLQMPLSLSYLRLSFIYTNLSNSDLTDREQKDILNIDDRSLLYYKSQLMNYISLKPFNLPN
ncbi:site-specific integrase [Lactobacillus taiwanensis]|uniref:site-specific integrase n=1 Tax=Lactobacillus taiwanensis TaxID=508451 RepID=UPI001AEC1532|nr:site-specific integrase [Lactobacillus taiwanensis]QTQ40786.1 site-specific integrase [Lactobacillus taiwanensis]